jgi:hypothetical protein
VRAKIVDSAKRGAANTCCIGKPRDKASGDFGRNPLGLARFWPVMLEQLNMVWTTLSVPQFAKPKS